MRPTLLASLALLAGCVTMPAVDPAVRVRPETGPECVSYCGQLGMRLGAVVLIRNAAGCVCQPRDDAAPASSAPRAEAGGSAVAGGAYVVALEEEARRQQQRQQQQQQAHPTSPGFPGSRPYSPAGPGGLGR